jgi:hypothetical protein
LKWSPATLCQQDKEMIMKTHIALFASVLVCAAIHSVSAESAAATPIRLNLELVDGSRLAATTTLTSLKMHTSLADLDIPVTNILRMVLSTELGKSSVLLRNGDRLSGDLKLDRLPVESLLGRGTLEVKHIERVEILTRVSGISGMQLPDGLVLYYPLDNTGTVASDMSGSAHDGSVKGAKSVRDGKSGRALAFGGDDYIQCDDVRIGPAVTYAAWIRPDTIRTGSDFYVFRAGRDHETLAGHHYTVELLEQRNWGEPSERRSGGTRIRAGGMRATVIDGRYVIKEAREWYHIAATVNENGELIIYVDGAKDTTGSVATAEVRSLYIGKPGFRGIIDEIMVFDRALTETEVQAVYRAHK